MSVAAFTRIQIPSLGRLFVASLLYVAWSLAAAIIAIAQGLPAEFGGFVAQRSVAEEFIYGMGTALSPPVYWLVAQSILTALLLRSDVWGTVGTAGLLLSGIATSIGAAGEPITLRVFAPATFDPMVALIQAGMIAIPAAIAVLAALELRRRSRPLAQG